MIFSAADVQQLVQKHYALHVTVDVLKGYDELNYLLTNERGKKYILKIATDNHGYAFLEAQVKIINYLNTSTLAGSFQRFALNTEGKELTHLVIGKTNYYLRLLEFLDGTFWADCKKGLKRYIRTWELLWVTWINL